MARNRPFVLPILMLMLALPLTSEARPLDAPKAPPAEPVYEVDPGERNGYTRVEGHWEWTGDNYMWSPGRWVEERAGSVWVNDNWTQRGKKWHLTPGHYESDGSAPEPAILPEPSDTQHEARAEHPDTGVEEIKERGNEPTVKANEMDDVEQSVLAPSTKPAKPTTKQATTHRTRQHKIIKKSVQPNYKDPKLYPFHRRGD